MSDYSAFFLMKPEDVKRYAVDVLHFFQPDEETDCVEIGDGNINYVFQVRSRKDGRSVIVSRRTSCCAPPVVRWISTATRSRRRP